MKNHPITMTLAAFACLTALLGLLYFLFSTSLRSEYDLVIIFLIGIIASNIVAKTLSILFDNLHGR